MSLYDDVLRAWALLDAQPYEVHRPLLSPRCGLHDKHDECRSAMCECDCHSAAKVRPLYAVASPMRRCLVHAESYETTCRGCESDRKGVSA